MSTRRLYKYHIVSSNSAVGNYLHTVGAYPEYVVKETSRGISDEHLPVEEDEERRIERERVIEGAARIIEGTSRLGENGSGGEPTVTEVRPGGRVVVEYGNKERREFSPGGGSTERLGTDSDCQVSTALGVGVYGGGGEKGFTRLYNGPWKLVASHTGTKRKHWHFIYISSSNQWGHSSRLGRTIRSQQYKCESIACVACLRQYIYSGNGRQVLSDILEEVDFDASICAAHHFGVENRDGAGVEEYRNSCAPWGNSTLLAQSGTPSVGLEGMDVVAGPSDAAVSRARRDTVEHESRQSSSGEEQANGQGRKRLNRIRGEDHLNNAELVLLLCKERAFNEGDAARVLSKSVKGLNFMFKPRANDRLRIAIQIGRLLVFQETIKQRFLRAKAFDKALNDAADDGDSSILNFAKLDAFLIANGIDQKEFYKTTFMHFIGQTGKKNNLFFEGGPSTGKTMIMDSLVAAHFNFSKLTGLTPGSSFNFGSVIHTNACFMDECKLTNNQFEQWKQLAGKTDCNTDVKYKDRHIIKDCILYTAANFPIEMYVNVPEASEAVRTRTIMYRFYAKCDDRFLMTAFDWEYVWGTVDCHV